MKFFVDTAEINSIAELDALGLVDGVTTNPTLVKNSGRDFRELIAEICELITGPVSAEVLATDADAMIREGRALASISENVVIKLPLTLDGLKACRVFSDDGIPTNVTLCFSANQALLAAKAGASYISPFIGRLDDINVDGIELIHNIRRIYDNFGFTTELLAASIRNPMHVQRCALEGADVITAPPAVIRGLADHTLTEHGLSTFLKDAASGGVSL